MLDTPQEVWELLFGGKFLLEIRQTWLAAALLPLTLILASVPAAANAFSPLTDSVGGTVQQQEATATAVPTVPHRFRRPNSCTHERRDGYPRCADGSG